MLSTLHFAKQFFIAPKAVEHSDFSDWKTIPLTNGDTLRTHPMLEFSISQNANTQLVLLDTIIDPERPLDSNQSILDNILLQANTFEDIEQCLYGLGGRWVLIVSQLDGSSRVYHDATGLKSVFYCRVDKSQYIVASQPALIEKLGLTTRNQSLFDRFEKIHPEIHPGHLNYWPLGLIPFDNVQQLLPNHYLQLNGMTCLRYWPNNSIERPTENTDLLADQINQLLRGSLQALMHRKSCTMSLTAGMDTRVLLACSLSYREKINFFTIRGSYVSNYDIRITPKLVAKFGLDHHFIDISDQEADLKTGQHTAEILLNNVSGMLRGGPPFRQLYEIKKLLGQRVHVIGVTEIGRCYYSQGKREDVMRGGLLPGCGPYKDIPEVIDGCNQWLDSVPQDIPYNIRDLVFWEIRSGIGLSVVEVLREALFQRITLTNNRKIMDLFLAAPVGSRLAPHTLIRKIIALNEPKLLKLPFNTGRMSDVFVYYKFPRLYRIKTRLRQRQKRIKNRLRQRLKRVWPFS